MPTAARLIAAFALAAACVAMYPILLIQYPEERFDLNQEILLGLFAGVGLMVGWFSLGKRISYKLGSGIPLGMRAAVTCAVWIAGLVGLLQVLDRMGRHSYQEPMQAVLDLVGTAWSYFGFLLDWKVAGAALFLGITAGMLTENANRRWR